MLWGAAGGDWIMNEITCDVCEDEGYVPCEECNADIRRPEKPRETPQDVHKREVAYWVMVKGEIEQFNRVVRG